MPHSRASSVRRALALAVAATVPGGAVSIRAQPCPFRWTGASDGGMGQYTGSDRTTRVRSFAQWDPDGPGPEPVRLVAAGAFREASGMRIDHVALWNGERWAPLDRELGDPRLGTYRALAVLDPDGAGPQPGSLYLAGRLSDDWLRPSVLARWDGESWGRVPTPEWLAGEPIRMVAFDDGSGPALYLCGHLFGPRHQSSRLVRFDGSEWSVAPGLAVADCQAMAILDDGGGPTLYVGGVIVLEGSQQRCSVAKWDGAVWTPLGTEDFGQGVYALAAVDHDGNGGEPPVIYAGGAMPHNAIAAWRGGRWEDLGTGIFARYTGLAPVRTLLTFDDGSGPALYVGGTFERAGNVVCNALARWDGREWSLPSGAEFWYQEGVPSLAAMTVFDLDGAGPQRSGLIVAGRFGSVAGIWTDNIARLDEGRWMPLGAAPNNRITCLHPVEASSNPRLERGLYAGGLFNAVESQHADGIARWDGSAWHALAPGAPVIRSEAMSCYGEGPENSLYVAGLNAAQPAGAAVARWDGQAWSIAGDVAFTYTATPHVGGAVRALVPFDDGTSERLYAAGIFDRVGPLPASHLARWDGQTWEPIPTPWTVPRNEVVSMTAWDDGARTALYVAGAFGDISGSGRVYRWDGANWEAIHVPTWYRVDLLEAGSAGPTGFLYAAGFLARSEEFPYGIARWDGRSWTVVSEVTTRRNPNIHPVFGSLVVRTGLLGDELHVFGGFTELLPFPVASPARWDGQQWVPLANGVLNLSWSIRGPPLAFFDDDGPGKQPAALYLGGGFKSVDYKPIANFARWACGEPGPPCTTDCDPGTGPGVLDIFDFLCFQRRFDAGDPYACDRDTSNGLGVCDVFDYLDYLNAFVAGCP